MEKIAVPINSEMVRGTVLRPENLKQKNPALLFIHGWQSSEEGYIRRAQALLKLGFICLTINLRGHGTSDGKLEDYSRADHLNDVLAAYDVLVSQPTIDTSRIGVIGASYGGYLASLLTAEKEVRWLVMRAPALYADNDFTVPTAQLIAQEETKAFRHQEVRGEGNRALKAAQNFTGDILLIESEKDTIIPHQTILNFQHAADPKKLTYEVIKDATHDLSTEEWKQQFIHIVVSWFAQQLHVK
jgi:uncharacterized protein